MIKDISPYIKMYDSSIYIFSILITIICVIFYYLFKHFYIQYKNKKENSQQYILNKFQSIDFNNPKQAAYDITKYGKLLAKTNESKQVLNQLNILLEQYKYKKDVSNLDNEIKQKYNQFMLYIDKQK